MPRLDELGDDAAPGEMQRIMSRSATDYVPGLGFFHESFSGTAMKMSLEVLTCSNIFYHHSPAWMN